MEIALSPARTVTDLNRGVTACQKTAEIEQGRHCLLRITSAPEDGGARPSAPSASSVQEIVPCATTALPVARRRTVDGPSGWSYRDRPRQSLEIEWRALADGADANIGRRSGQRKMTTPPEPRGHKRGGAPYPLCTQSTTGWIEQRLQPPPCGAHRC
jgi:hypothetical protein